MRIMDSHKTCATCQIEYPVEDFTDAGYNRKDCKACRYASRRKKWSSSYSEYLNKLHNQARSARAKDYEWTINTETLVKLWQEQDGHCALSGVAMTHHRDGTGKKEFNASIDRIDQNAGYTPQNIQLVCYRVNILRHNLPEDMFYWWIKTIHEQSCD